MLKLNRMKQKANYVWRIGATGLSFASFGLGGMAIGGVIAPMVKLSSQDPDVRKQRTQKVIKYSFKGFTEMMVKLGIMTYSVEGLEKLQQSQQELVIANHPTLIDVVVLIGLMEQANCVVKQALWSNPFTKGPVQNAGYILNAGSEQFIQDCVQKLQQDNAASLLIFPEGTRTAKGEQLNEFQRGAANIALRAGVPIRPVLITCTPSTLTKNEKWHHIPERPFHIHVKVLDAIRVEDVLDDVAVNPKNVRQLNQQLQWFFNQELSVNE
ncbi:MULTISPECIES: lysophospholipid acyltransferase family protein [Acinetobacter]|uniref:lysophospholipid acyltransferase family protein n=1 Tax=Acinetobacter TaxID=469 RepID=UPI000378FC09|nr:MULTISPECIES: lysophospholipid acyltransferase family protein [Acinetobacter]MCO8060055.1 1-acyl-sn-glycerol-3-phosphate acyltransferase [Acinetobacter towneri]MCO8065705.1 1-acyl-sn-glycerol-3-phosphate acyltransferase [Acinetobacter towneri]MDV2454142.1 lysophospholipid acyltransferase family protein [Acinetobacter towneri]UNT65440.1 1-acyl-sn-glycerol-3-phosphate acyltransferase [Acinetobacter towneri]